MSIFTTPIISAYPKNTAFPNYKSANQLLVSNKCISIYSSNSEYGERVRYQNNINSRDDTNYSKVFICKCKQVLKKKKSKN